MAEFGYMGGQSTGPTLGTLEAQIAADNALNVLERNVALMRLRQDTRGLPKSTPLRDLVRELGGGVLGFLVSKYFGMTPVAQALSALAGYGIGKTVNDFYKGYRQ